MALPSLFRQCIAHRLDAPLAHPVHSPDEKTIHRGFRSRLELKKATNHQEIESLNADYNRIQYSSLAINPVFVKAIMFSFVGTVNSYVCL